MSGTISHIANVVDILPDALDLQVKAQGACGSCAAKGGCGMAESQDKMIRVITSDACLYSVGEEVEVSIEQLMGIKAIVLAYIFPFLLVFPLLLIMLQCGVSELFSGLTALGTLLIYYIVLYLFRGKISKEISFRVNKI